MPTSSWLLTVAVAFIAIATGVIRPLPVAARAGDRRRFWTKVLAAARVVSGALLVLLLFLQSITAADSFSAPVRWSVWGVAAAGTLAYLINAVAGLWLLSPYVGADPGCQVVASGTRGTIRNYGWSRLEMASAAGWSVHLPYWSVACRPLAVRREDTSRTAAVTFRRERWSHDELRYVRQAVLVCPYRDPFRPVSVLCRSGVLNVRLGLSQRASKARVQHYLDLALAGYREPASSKVNELPDDSS